MTITNQHAKHDRKQTKHGQKGEREREIDIDKNKPRLNGIEIQFSTIIKTLKNQES